MPTDTAQPSRPLTSEGAKAALAAFVGRVTVLAAGVDVFYLVFFLAVGSSLLAWINLVSVGMYLTAYAMVRRRRLRAAIALIWLEAFPHAALGTLLLGWESGFHYLLLMFIPAVAITSNRRQMLAFLAVLIAFLIGMDAASRHWGALAPIPEGALLALKWINLATFVAMFSATASHYQKKIASAERHLATLATEDALTGLHNRRHFQVVADQELARVQRKGSPCCLLITDIDHFKKINDSRGHEAGDRVLVHVAGQIKAGLRAGDALARWGGEEFVLLMPDTEIGGAAVVAERIRAAVEAGAAPFGDGQIRCTLSFGVAAVRPGEALNTVLARADEALYRSKAEGRNRVNLAAAE